MALLGVAGLAVFLVFAWIALIRISQEVRLARAMETNRLLQVELDQIQTRADELAQKVEGLTNLSDRTRLLAGMNELPEEVQSVGVGGPGLRDMTEDRLYQLDRPTGRQTFQLAADLDRLIRRAQLLNLSFHEAAGAFAEARDRLEAIPSIWPTRGYISSGFTNRRFHPIFRSYAPHWGIDITASRGTPVVATASGRVRSVGRNIGYGLFVELDHGYGFRTRYAHNSKVAVKQGQWIERGRVIAYVGDSGISTAPHVHYEVLLNGVYKDPGDYILEKGGRRILD